MKIIFSQLFNIKHLYFLLFLFSYIFKTLFNDLIEASNCDISRKLFNIYLNNLSHFITIIPLYIRSKNVKKNKIVPNSLMRKTTTEVKNKQELIFEEKDFLDGKYKNKFRRTFLLSLFNILAELSFLIFNMINVSNGEREKHYLNSYYVFNIIIQYLVCIPILKTSFSRHHYFSLAINCFCLLIYIIIDIFQMIFNDSFQISFLIMRILRLSFFAIKNVIGKKAMMKNFMTPFSLLLYEGIYDFVFLLVFSIPFSFIKIIDYIGEDAVNLFYQIGNFVYGINILYILLLLFSDFFYVLFLWIIIDIFSPSHLVLALILENFGYTVYTMIKKGEEYNYDYVFFITIIFTVLLFLSALVHNEIIIINICGLHKDTKYYLNFMAIEDVTNVGEDRIDSFLSLKNEEGNEDIEE